MSIYTVKRGGDGHEENYKEFMITAVSDVSDLPTGLTYPSAAPGSMAYTLDLSKCYMLGIDNIWREV